MNAGVSIRTKLLAGSVLLLGALLAVAAYVLIEVVGSSFETLERREARQTAQTIRNTIEREIAALSIMVQDWAEWDDTYDFVETEDPQYVTSNLVEGTSSNSALNLLVIEDLEGRVVWGRGFDLDKGEFITLPDFVQGAPLLRRITDKVSEEGSLRGLVSTRTGPMMIAVSPILTSAVTGPRRGYFMMGRLLTDDVLSDLGEALGLVITAQPPVAGKAAATAASEDDLGIVAQGEDALRAFIVLRDLFGDPVVVLSTTLERTVTAVGRAAQITGLAVTGAAGLVLIGVFLFSQQVLVLGPLARLTQRVEQIGRNAEPDEPLPETRRDELGILAQAFNRMQDRVNRLTNFDPTTGLPNRRLFHDRANQVLHIARRRGEKAAMLFVDLDDFKGVNDTRGHTVGDGLLRVIGEELSDLMRETDTVARFGGDEFAVAIHPVQETAQIADLTERLHLRFQQPFRVSGTSLFTNASIGVAVFPDDGETVEALISLADAAMYQAKKDGGRGIAFIDAEALQADGHLRSLEQAFREAMNAEQLHLVFQPQIDLASGAVVGHEALVRWRHPDQGMLAAGRFIHLAERAGTFAQFDTWVLRAACQAMKRGDRHGGAPLGHVSVNICARHVQTPSLVGVVMGILRETGVSPDRLTLELTETVMVTRPDAAIEVLSTLRQAGVRVVIDDFGTGYASMAALHRFPIDGLKIDRSFVTGLPDDRSALAITQASLTLAGTLGLTVTAEGVETPEQRDMLIEAGCKTAQGFLWGDLA